MEHIQKVGRCTSYSDWSRQSARMVGGVAQWLGRRSVAGGLSLIHA